MSLPNRLMGVWTEYSKGATTLFPSISMGTGSVSGVICLFPEKPTVLIEDCERGRYEPSFPMHEYAAPVSTIKSCCLSLMVTVMVGSSFGSLEMTGSIPLPLGSSGHPYS